MEQKKQGTIDELPFWHGLMLTIFYIFPMKNTKKKMIIIIIINDRIIDMKKILFLGNKMLGKM